MATMSFMTFGNQDSKPLLFLHGWGVCGEKYAELGRILAKDFFVIIPDLPGFGKTPAPAQAFSVQDYASSMMEFIHQQGLKRVFLLCHSFGGRIALKLASEHSELFTAMILSGTPGVERFSLKRSLKRSLAWLIAKVLKPFRGIPQVERIRSRFYEKRDLGKLEGVMKETFLKVVAEDLTPCAKKISLPTLLLWGIRDRLTPVMDGEKLLEVIPGSYLKIFANVGHALPYEKPHEFARDVRSFLFRYL